LLKNWLSLNKIFSSKQGQFILVLFCSFIHFSVLAQVNIVGNPSFETLINCSTSNAIKYAKYWNGLDSATTVCGGLLQNVCFGNVPATGYGFQLPKTGNGFAREQSYCTSATCFSPYYRTYPKNRLLSTLIANKVYCVKMHINSENIAPLAIDSYGIYLGDASLDTIKYCGMPLTFLTPQIQNIPGNYISDTLNWIEVSGTFTATGTEKYLIIGDFKTDAATTTTTNGSSYPGVFSEYFLDDVSVIDYNLPSTAGPDKNITLGDSAFLGIPPEIGLECVWTTGTVTVGTGGGIWVKPPTTGTYSYVVTQNICGNIKKDTVNVNISLGLISESELFSQNVSVYPQPSNGVVNIKLTQYYDSSVKIGIADINAIQASIHKHQRTQSQIAPFPLFCSSYSSFYEF
jgi:hypothetical protein